MDHKSNEMEKMVEKIVEEKLKEARSSSGAERKFSGRSRLLGFLTAFLFAGGIMVFSATVTKPFDFNYGDTIVAEQINSNFNVLYDGMNDTDTEIAANASDITTLQTGVSGNDTDISALSNDLAPYLNTVYVSDGKVGIGTDSPTTAFASYDPILHIYDSSANAVRLFIGGESLYPGGYITGGRSVTTENWELLSLQGANYQGGQWNDSAWIQFRAGAGVGGAGDTPGKIAFGTASDGSSTPTERMIIDENGNIGIGTTLPNSYTLTVSGTAYCSSGAWSGSDIRWKENVADIDSALDAILQLRGVTFDWNTTDYPDNGFTDARQVGFIAQEVEEIIPELVSTGEDGYKALAYDRMSAYLVEAVKELAEQKNAEIAALEVELETVTVGLETVQVENAVLEAKNAELEETVSELEARLEEIEKKLALL